MNRKIRFFQNVHLSFIESNVNEFARSHNIVQINSYESKGYHVCVVLYEESEKVEKND